MMPDLHVNNIFSISGVMDPQSQPGLTDEAKAELSELLSGKIKDRQTISSLLEQMDDAVKTYGSARVLQDKLDPATVRANLKKTSKAVLALNDSLNGLDEQTLWLLEQDGKDSVNQIRSAVSYFLVRLNVVTSIAKRARHRGGRLTDIPKRFLVAHIAHLFRTLTTIKPTTTVEGFFEQIVSVIITDIEHRRAPETQVAEATPSVHDLILKGLRIKVTEQPDGVVSFDPWVGKPRRKKS